MTKDYVTNTLEYMHILAEEKGYKFLSDKYINSRTKYIWECSNMHQWEAPYNSIKTGHGCWQCHKIPFKFYVDLIKDKGGTILTLEKEYKDTTTYIKYICKEGHCNESRSLKNGSWCIECNTLVSEKTCRKIFEYLFQKPFIKSRHLINPDSGNKFELDGYNEELKLAFEYNGIQHYKRVVKWHTEEDFEKQKNRDKCVEKLCKESGINLIVIPYTVKYENLYSFIVDKFPEHNFEKTIKYEIFEIKSKSQDYLDEVRKIIQKYDGILLTKYYISSKTKMDFLCKNGHKFQSTHKSIKIGRFCKLCANIGTSNRAIPTIEKFCTDFNYELCSIYTKSLDKLQWKCTKCDTIFTRSWNSLNCSKKSHKCPNKD